MNLQPSEIDTGFITFCGIFPFSTDDFIDKYPCNSNAPYGDWWQHLMSNGSDFFFRTNYYPNFTNIILSNKCANQQSQEKENLTHLYLKDVSAFSNLELLVAKKDASYKLTFRITKIDIYFFSEKLSSYKKERLGLYSFTTELTCTAVTKENISDFINVIRVFDRKDCIIFDNLSYSPLQFIEKFIIKKSIPYEYMLLLGNKLKSFTIINLSQPPENWDDILYDIGTVSPIGTSKSDNFFAPSREYITQLIGENKISVFNNWSALTLFDTFTCILHGWKREGLEQTWCETYCLIYIHCLHLKFYLYAVNTELADITEIKSNSNELKNNFIEFVNDYNLMHLSYNFLPNLLYDKIRHSLEIQSEIEMMEKKVERLDVIFNEQRENRMNQFLTLLALLSVGSVLWDVTEFIRSMSDINEEKFYPWGSWIVLIIFMSGFSIYLFLKYIKKKTL